MKLFVEPASHPLSGTIAIPGDKSIGHRALLFSLLSATPVRVLGLGDGADNGRSARAVTQLGGAIARDGAALVIRGSGLDAMRPPAAGIDCGNSGTTIRLLCGLVAGQRFATTLFGDESLSRRPMQRVIEPLAAMGAVITGSPAGEAARDVVPPLTIGPATGPLTAIDYTLPMASAQVKSAILLAGLYADGVTAVTEPGPTRDHSERMLAYLGAPLTTAGRRVAIDTRGWNRRLAGDGFEVPGDPSSAAFLIAAALLAGAREVRLPGICVNPTRTGFLDAIAAMGGSVEHAAPRDAGPEPVADLVVRGPAPGLRATEIAGDLAVRAIDELPVLAVIAARAHGTTTVRDAGELRVKESDRIATTCAMLRAFGVSCEPRPDGFVVEGRPDRPLAAARVASDGDHRIAMAAAIAGLVADGPSQIDDADNVATSYPGFAAALRQLGGAIRDAAG
ncbi:MAG: 3-phosphoshikimate 1-carboxyvinyltransferase [Deltaproteobacteria bacterium]|nr:MAG: 3-phosphoshikimate 1-carboxyvinyltransferase [Deltaproteobacteria bacterium]TMQ17778.1 MAG: 3-phosphoshikimate 1-carboxyvinyltransferase [Deltaproteobacteria bacterium]